MHPFMKSVLSLLGHFQSPEVHDAAHAAVGAGVPLFSIFLTLLQFLGSDNFKGIVAALLALIAKQPPTTGS